MTKFVLLSVVAIVTWLAGAEANECARFREEMEDVKSSIHTENKHDLKLEKDGYTLPDNVFGASPTYDDCSLASGKNAHLHTAGAQWFAHKYGLSPADFDNLATSCNVFEKYPATCQKPISDPPKYRPIDGLGNNKNNPQWGASDTPFARYQTNGYSDGIYEVKKSVSGKDLPNARWLAQNVLAKGTRSNPPPLSYGVFALLTVLFITHDVHYQTPIQPSNSSQEIQCCTADSKSVLNARKSNPSCFPIEVPKDDACYTVGNIGCYNFVRSQQAEYQNQAQSGEIMNRATSFLDLSLIYGNHESECTPIRLFSGGQLRMGKNGVLPVDQNGAYLPSMRRFTTAPIASIWPSLFARNHNHMAARLAVINPQWDDETLFQEARRINIAIFQNNLITQKAVEASISNIPINETYSAEKNAATSLEFAIAYRMAHYYIHDQMVLEFDDGSIATYLQSDTIGRIDILEDHYEPALRGALGAPVNSKNYGDEITNRIGKLTPNGYGHDIIAIDIQRARDQGLPSFLDVRRKCNFAPINSFDDLATIMDPANAALLKSSYENVEDVDYYVGGILETYAKLGNPLVGPTFGCVIAHQWDNFAGGDIYYYSNPSSPYPFTPAQIEAVHEYSISGLICATTSLNGTAAVWPYAPNEELDPTTNEPVNPFTLCDAFPEIDLSPWQV